MADGVRGAAVEQSVDRNRGEAGSAIGDRDIGPAGIEDPTGDGPIVPREIGRVPAEPSDGGGIRGSISQFELIDIE